MKGKQRGRRRFLKGSAVLAALAAGGIRSASGQKITPVETFESTTRQIPPRFQPTERRLYGTPSPFETVKRAPKTPGTIGWMTPLQDLTGVITPNGLHFEIGMPAVDIDPRQHRLLIHGLVDRPLILTREDLKHLPSVSRVYFIECGGNGSTTGQRYMRNGGFMKNEGLTLVHTHGSTSCAEWTGVPLSVLFKEVGVQKGASRPEAPGLRPDEKGRWWQYEIGPKSVITFPSIGQHLSSRGFYEIIGLAWSGGGAIRRVEVSTDGGRSWKDARLDEPVHRFAHTRFRFPWNWDGKETVIASRCTDERGGLQPSLEEFSKIWGVELEHWITAAGRTEYFNPINPWRITREGRVRNALYPLPL